MLQVSESKMKIRWFMPKINLFSVPRPFRAQTAEQNPSLNVALFYLIKNYFIKTIFQICNEIKVMH